MQLGQGSVRFDTTGFHNVQLSFNGSQIQVSYDGNVVISVTDATYSAGAIALDVSSQVVNFTNVMVTAATANTGSMTVAPASLNFTANYGSGAAPQNVQLTGNNGSIVWTAVSNATWLSVSPGWGLASSTPQVSVAAASLTPRYLQRSRNLRCPGRNHPDPDDQCPIVRRGATALYRDDTWHIELLRLGFPAGRFANVTGREWRRMGNVQPDCIQQCFVAFRYAQQWHGAAGAQCFSESRRAGGRELQREHRSDRQWSGNSPQNIPVTLQVLTTDMNETFQDLATGWIISPMGFGNGWSVSNGTYSYSGLGFSQSCAGSPSWADYIVDSNIKLSNLSNWPGGVRGRVNPATGSGYAVWLYPGSGQMILYSVSQWNINNGFVQLAAAPHTFDLAAHDLKLDFHGNVISVYWDGVFMMSATDSTYSNGYVCMDADSQPISYSNVQVNGIQSAITLDNVSPSSFVFNSVGGVNPPVQTVNVTAGGAITTWSASSNAAWLTVSESTNLTPGQLSLSANPTGLAPGGYSGVVTLSAPGAVNSPISIPVDIYRVFCGIVADPGEFDLLWRGRLYSARTKYSGCKSWNWRHELGGGEHAELADSKQQIRHGPFLDRRERQPWSHRHRYIQ